MSEQHYTATIAVNKPAAEVFRLINEVSLWWTADLQGNTNRLNDEFRVRFETFHVSTQKVTELIPNRKVTWLVTDSQLSFIDDHQEWTGTHISFELSETDQQTQVRLTHFGLTPESECYGSCRKGWDYYLHQSLYPLLTEGRGKPGLPA